MPTSTRKKCLGSLFGLFDFEPELVILELVLVLVARLALILAAGYLNALERVTRIWQLYKIALVYNTYNT